MRKGLSSSNENQFCMKNFIVLEDKAHLQGDGGRSQ